MVSQINTLSPTLATQCQRCSCLVFAQVNIVILFLLALINKRGKAQYRKVPFGLLHCSDFGCGNFFLSLCQSM